MPARLSDKARKMRLNASFNKCFVLLLSQAILVTSGILILLFYYPEIATDVRHDEHFAEVSDRLDKIKRQREILQERRHMAAGVTVKFDDGTNCTLFRFDYMPGKIEYDPEPMVNDEGKFSYFAKDENYEADQIPEWFDTQTDYCGGCFVVYGVAKYLVSLKDVTIYPQFSHGKIGGEDIEDVIMQSEADEVISLEKGYFVVNTNSNPQTDIPTSVYLEEFMNGLIFLKETNSDILRSAQRQGMVAVMITRREYANFYHVTMDLYDVFLIMVLFKIEPDKLELIWLDAHPKSNLDATWKTLYGAPIRAGSLTSPVKYNNMVWSGFGHKSHINQHQVQYLPFVNEFRHFVLSRFHIVDNHVIDCNQLRITLIWRRHYVSHPRNPKGYVVRRIANEREVWTAVQESDNSAIVNGAQLEKLDMVEQLELISKTDILIGMHGAGLTHILYLPQSSGVIELFPKYLSVANGHFRALSKWRHLRHIVWINRDQRLEAKDHETTIPTDVIKNLVREMKKNLCENK